MSNHDKLKRLYNSIEEKKTNIKSNDWKKWHTSKQVLILAYET